VLQPQPTDDAARIFALVYALGQLPQNLTDVANRESSDGQNGAFNIQDLSGCD
jgi:hypothetical protein